MISTGKPISAPEALDAGLVDRIVEGDLRTAALAFGQAARGPVPADRRISARVAQASLSAIAALAEATRKRARGTEAPGVAMGLVRTALTTSFEEGMALEREAFLRLRASEQAAALRHIFFAERATAKAPAVGQARPISRVGVVGAGTLGAGIAMSAAEAGLDVTIVELSADALQRGLERIRQGYERSVERGRLDPTRVAAHQSRIAGSTDYADLADCDLVIEAAFESIEVKHDIFARLNAVAKPGALLASNTSYLDLDAIAERSGRAADVGGLHYFSPANVMRLLEVVRGRHTAPDVIATALAFAKRTRKVPVVAGVCNGFIGNHMLKAYVREAGLLVAEGVAPDRVDDVLVGFGMAMGPFAVADLSGIDIGYKARRAMVPGSFEPLAVALHDALVEAGHLGRKSGSGFYVYEPDGQGKSPNPLLGRMIERIRIDAGIAPRAVADQEIVDRCMFALANEGGFILDEGIAACSGDIDVVYVNGDGFPRHRGGPMFYAAQRGLDEVRGVIARLAQGPFGKRWAPSSFLAGGPGDG